MNPSFSWKLFKIIQQLILSIDQESCLQETQKPGDAFWYMFLFISNPKLPGSYIVFFFFCWLTWFKWIKIWRKSSKAYTESFHFNNIQAK